MTQQYFTLLQWGKERSVVNCLTYDFKMRLVTSEILIIDNQTLVNLESEKLVNII